MKNKTKKSIKEKVIEATNNLIKIPTFLNTGKLAKNCVDIKIIKKEETNE